MTLSNNPPEEWFQSPTQLHMKKIGEQSEMEKYGENKLKTQSIIDPTTTNDMDLWLQNQDFSSPPPKLAMWLSDDCPCGSCGSYVDFSKPPPRSCAIIGFLPNHTEIPKCTVV